MACVPSVRMSRCRTVTVPDDEFNRVIDAADPRLVFGLTLARFCGLRIGTILRLAPRNYNAGHIRITTKGGVWLDLPTTPRVQMLLDGMKQLCPVPDAPFLRQLGVKCPYQLARRLRAAQALAKCPKLWTFHDLRRTYARQMYAVANDLRLVQKAMGHKSSTHTLWYLNDPQQQVTSDDMQSAEPPEGTIQ